MTNPTSNFGWQMPTPTDLVTDLPADFEVFGQAVDTSLADLQGGTTGQILSKATNADMDFTWITNDVGDITAVNVTSPITGGGSSGAVTIGINAATTSVVGAVQLSDSTSTTSSVLASTPTATKSAYDLADSAYAPAFTNNFYAGKNKLINGDMNIWQRGTTFTNPANGAFTADRWRTGFETAAPTSYEITRQTFTPGSEAVSGYNSQYFLRGVLTTVGTCTKIRIQQRIEDVGTFANKIITVSFYAKSDSNRTQTVSIEQLFGSGGSSAVVSAEQTINTTTAWQRFSVQFTVPSISGKTIGTGSSTQITINQNLTNGNTLDIWGVQTEAGSTATPFQTASGSIGGELALCQRYYYRTTPGIVGAQFGAAASVSTTVANVIGRFPVTMRTKPTALEQSGTANQYAVTFSTVVTACSAVPVFGGSTTENDYQVNFTVASGLTAGQAGRGLSDTTNGATAYLGWSAEL